MRYLASLLIVFILALITACSGGDIASSINLYEFPGDEEGRVVIDPDDFELEFRFDFDPRNAKTQCRFEDEDWFDCESPYRLTQDSEEFTISEGYLNFAVRSYQEEDTSSPDKLEMLVLYDFDFALDDAEEYIPGSPDTTFYFPDEYTASCSRDDCELHCYWDAEGLDGTVDADCNLDEPFDLVFPDDELENAELLVDACATDFGGDEFDEHCKGPKSYLFYPPPPEFVHIDSGSRHNCGLVEDGSLWCWGQNNAGQVGVSRGDDQIPLATKVGESDWESFSTGLDHTCAIRTGGELYCWGDNSRDQLGIEPSEAGQPELVDAGPWDIVAAGGSHTCAIDDGGDLYCWGFNSDGQLGNTAAESGFNMWNVALPAGASNSWIDVTAGEYHTCGIAHRSGGGQAAYCWGNRGEGRLGDDTTAGSANTPQEVIADLGYMDTLQISASNEHTCAITNNSGDRNAYCWGEGSSGRLGTGSEVPRSAPLRIARNVDEQPNDAGYDANNFDDYVDIATGSEHSCGVHQDGHVYCWGTNVRDQLGTGEEDTTDPARVATPEGVQFQAISAGDEHTCAIDSSGFAYCWGRSANGRLGIGEGVEAAVPTLIDWPQGEFIPTPHADDE